ncbi:hypothetical protein [Weissella cibaria]|uniref:hypothetical protein n=1 Tax=Weissella cibaria TaxID=137591 RepID=UPI001D0580E7|nr:hypothetical protein [Weissella cibaria]
MDKKERRRSKSTGFSSPFSFSAGTVLSQPLFLMFWVFVRNEYKPTIDYLGRHCQGIGVAMIRLPATQQTDFHVSA